MRGYLLPRIIDDDANEYYQLAPGEFAKEVRASIREEETEDGHARFFPLTADGNCPFLDRTGLCRIILQMGEGALCTTCREYPRYYIEAGDTILRPGTILSRI